MSDSKNFQITSWDLKRSAKYGSKHYNERELKIESSQLQQDGRTVILKVVDLAPTRGMEIEYSVLNADGERVGGKIHNTIHQLSK